MVRPRRPLRVPVPVPATPERAIVEPEGRGLDIVASRFAPLQEELAVAVGDASLCAISRTAGSVPAAKQLEGRLAVLMALRRSLRRGDRWETTLAEQLDAWRRALDDVTAREAGSDWRAYRAGGVDELEELAARLPGPDA